VCVRVRVRVRALYVFVTNLLFPTRCGPGVCGTRRGTRPRFVKVPTRWVPPQNCADLQPCQVLLTTPPLGGAAAWGLGGSRPPEPRPRPKSKRTLEANWKAGLERSKPNASRIIEWKPITRAGQSSQLFAAEARPFVPLARIRT